MVAGPCRVTPMVHIPDDGHFMLLPSSGLQKMVPGVGAVPGSPGMNSGHLLVQASASPCAPGLQARGLLLGQLLSSLGSERPAQAEERGGMASTGLCKNTHLKFLGSFALHVNIC